MTIADGTTTPVTDLHSFGLTSHQTRPLHQAEITTVEHLEELVDQHADAPAGSQLASVSGLGAGRVKKICDAVQAWRARD